MEVYGPKTEFAISVNILLIAREVEIKGGICYHLATLELLVPIDTSYKDTSFC